MYFREKGNNTTVFYAASLSDDMVCLKAKNSDNELTSTVENFNDRFIATTAQLTLWQKFKDTYWMITIQLALFLILVLWELFEIRSAKKLSKIFKE